MSAELRVIGAAASSIVVVMLATPIAIRLALRTGFLDVPVGYKGHRAPTPYLGGAVALAAVLVGGVLFGGDLGRSAPIVAGAVVLWGVGTVDDRRGLPPLPRVLVEVGAATCLWATGLGWSLFSSELANLALTNLWVVGIVNAFNLMDNMDGAAPSVATVCGSAVGLLALGQDDIAVAAFALAAAGACGAFLRYNLTSPARIFLGDGGSMPIGFVIAACAIVAVETYASGWTALNAAVLLIGLPVFDTILVVVSRWHRGVAIQRGARDHLTHRMRDRLGSARAVALLLAIGQAVLCASAFAMLEGGAAIAASATALVLLPAVVIATRVGPPEPALQREASRSS